MISLQYGVITATAPPHCCAAQPYPPCHAAAATPSKVCERASVSRRASPLGKLPTDHRAHLYKLPSGWACVDATARRGMCYGRAAEERVCDTVRASRGEGIVARGGGFVIRGSREEAAFEIGCRETEREHFYP